MPKYFSGHKDLPATRIAFTCSSFTTEELERSIPDGDDTFSICITPVGTPNENVGYVFLVNRIDELFLIKDIKGTTLFRDKSLEQLFQIVQHSSGIMYSEDIHTEFYRVRNEIGLEQ
ncbi:hypothetical protein HYO48_21495 [Vibrio parahaemolyticus]|nr:hypothetical protein [Vibrio parahaemolyticus]